MTNYTGFQTPGQSSGTYNAMSLVIQQHIKRISTNTVAKVMGVTNAGGISPVGFVDIQPMVELIDGSGILIPHGTIYQCPYIRVQGGKNAVIIDPEVGDLGMVCFADRDISSVIANKGSAAPGSARRFDMSDGMYVGGLLNATPEQYVQMSSAGIKIHSPTLVTLDAPDVKIQCQTLEITATTSASITTPTFTVNGNEIVTGTVTAAEVDAPIVSVSTNLTVAGKDLGPTHIHDHGTLTATGHTGTVI